MIEQEQKRNQRSPQRAFLTVAAICALTLASTFGWMVRAQSSSNVPASSPNVPNARVLLAIDGMHCTTCANGIKVMLKRTPGVTSAEVSFERREADVEYDPSRTSPEKIIEAINNLGYKASVKEQKEA